MNGSDAIIARCVRHCADARDGRGRWRMRDETCAAMLRAGAQPVIATTTANASMALGAWIRQRGDDVSRELALCALGPRR